MIFARMIAAGRTCLLIGAVAYGFHSNSVNAQDLIADGEFLVPWTSATAFQTVPAGQSIGTWNVTSGSVDVFKKGGAFLLDKTHPGNAVDLAGGSAGTISQTVETEVGTTYKVSFEYAGNFTTAGTRTMTVLVGATTKRYSVIQPKGWSFSNLQWKSASFDYIATSPLTTIQLKSTSKSNDAGVIVTQIKLLALPPGPLSTVKVPLPDDLDSFVLDRGKAILLGKALFWDMQVGSDGRTACASCHFHAGVDNRIVNTLAPGAPESAFGPQRTSQAALEAKAIAEFAGANKTLLATDFPFFKVADPIGDRKDNQVLRDRMSIVGSQGVVKRNYVSINPGSASENGVLVRDPVYQVGGANARQVTERNSPTIINAIFHDRLFWDGRANHYFNGVNEFGALDPNARVFKRVITVASKNVATSELLIPTKILLNNGSAASQCVGPSLSGVEMSWTGKSSRELGRKMLSLRPLALQKVDPTDSVLGVYAGSAATGLGSLSYGQLIRDAFRPEWWSSPQPTGGFTHMEANFSLFWGLAIMMYESTLVSDKTPYDAFASGDVNALSASAKRGMKIYFNEGKCINCHGGSEFAGATVSDLRGASPELIERMQMQHSIANYDNGFYNIGVRKTLEDLGVGASHPVFGPLSYTGQKLAGKGVEQAITISPGDRVANDGAFKTPTLRNIELTGPYFHNGGTRTLTEAVQFYVRGADFYENPELDPDVHGIPELQGNPAAVEDLVAFLRGLTDERVRFQRAPFDHPELIIPNGSSGVLGGVVVDNIITLPAVGAGGGVAIQPFEQILK